MIYIQLIVTGSLEHKALRQSLEPLFPKVKFGVSAIKNSFTSNQPIQPPYAPPPPKIPTKPKQKVALPSIEALFAEALSTSVPKSPDNRPYDYTIIVDDLEVPNLGPNPQAALTQAQNVVTYARQALDAYLKRPENQTSQPLVPFRGTLSHVSPTPTTPQARRDFFQKRCSLHFLVPMVEALFFGEAQALQRAQENAPSKIPSQFNPATQDLEDFYVTHTGYLGWISPSQLPWYQSWMQYKHPKNYLEFLRGGAYSEPDGVSALQSLSWQQVVANPTYMQFTRAFLDDIAQMSNTTLPWLKGGTLHSLTCYKPKIRTRALRNM